MFTFFFILMYDLSSVMFIDLRGNSINCSLMSTRLFSSFFFSGILLESSSTMLILARFLICLGGCLLKTHCTHGQAQSAMTKLLQDVVKLFIRRRGLFLRIGLDCVWGKKAAQEKHTEKPKVCFKTFANRNGLPSVFKPR